MSATEFATRYNFPTSVNGTALDGTGQTKGFLDAISAAVHDSQRKPSVISISWGGPEISTDQQGVHAYHEMFAAAGALGITVCVASGEAAGIDR